jgi:hypothetical protein
MNFSVRELLPHVYHLHFERGYDLAMHFVRAQEYYESPRFFRKFFTMIDFMDWYAKEHGKGAFTYPTDWSGFNVPSTVLLEVYGPTVELPDPNRYDEFMKSLVGWASRVEYGHNFYFIGTSSAGYKGDSDEENVLDHEIAHALYFTNPKYRKAVTSCLAGMDAAARVQAKAALAAMGYHATTIDDEVHAYSATGLCKDLQGIISPADQKPFQKAFKEFRK